ncbi:MAG: hypothetical protein AVDCRST_MAG55-3217 [uncultured Rubrobacteraceae bacterium]|uniref:Uncharacterized protein n=1 Tax=uncultured Rubrobacteraceae bacterium TaxID=349277 RepID=A0A6J4QBS7_9ACTN|nr:MAG: hypothetical protein AVDCRST_MAG55-3217 [uncultured Rubrobacteraceae bacterium]
MVRIDYTHRPDAQRHAGAYEAHASLIEVLAQFRYPISGASGLAGGVRRCPEVACRVFCRADGSRKNG